MKVLKIQRKKKIKLKKLYREKDSTKMIKINLYKLMIKA